jgi:hypothetical protein
MLRTHYTLIQLLGQYHECSGQPGLKLVQPWDGAYDHLYEHPDSSDDEDTCENDGEEWRQVFEVDHLIFELAKSCDLRVERVQDTTAWKKGRGGVDR